MPKRSSQLGMSLIEVMVTLAVTTVIIVALISLVLTSLKNSQFAQNQIKATKYAQEALDKIKSIRDRDGIIQFQSTAVPTCFTTPAPAVTSPYKFSSLYRCNVSNSSNTPCTIYPLGGTFNGCYFLLTSTGDGLIEPSTPGLINQDLGDGLSRSIFIEDSPSDSETVKTVKTVVVKVKWTDNSGDHESNLQTILTPR